MKATNMPFRYWEPPPSINTLAMVLRRPRKLCGSCSGGGNPNTPFLRRGLTAASPTLSLSSVKVSWSQHHCRHHVNTIAAFKFDSWNGQCLSVLMNVPVVVKRKMTTNTKRTRQGGSKERCCSAPITSRVQSVPENCTKFNAPTFCNHLQ